MLKIKNDFNTVKWWQFPMLIVAGIVNATGVALFLLPSGVLDGGLSGTAILLSKITPLHVSLFLVILNVPFFLFAIFKQGPAIAACSLVAILSYSGMTWVFQTGLGLTAKMWELVGQDVFLCSIFGGIISGLGSGLTIRFGGAMDGVEVMAVLFAKKIGVTVGQFVMIYNIVIYTLACFLLGNFSVGLYSIVTYAIGLKAVDFVVDGFDKGKACIIITQKGDEMASVICREMGRGITLLDSKGFYSKETKTMMYCVVNRFEIGRLKKLVNQVDDTAFVTISEVSEVMGTGVHLRRRKRGEDTPSHMSDLAEAPPESETEETLNAAEETAS